jgi:uncharacterized protein
VHPVYNSHYLARIETKRSKISFFVQNPARDELISYFKDIGFDFITFDLEGYRTGSMDVHSTTSEETQN